ncbi:hypothetical protein SDC9_86332 [bioreactor metagenome]|uniref:Uncharacterized protein n=1 Tax=bioreactor metagenome TaxID=1076179 RepID=A0A644ZHB3_9ZZZZ
MAGHRLLDEQRCRVVVDPGGVAVTHRNLGPPDPGDPGARDGDGDLHRAVRGLVRRPGVGGAGAGRPGAACGPGAAC